MARAAATRFRSGLSSVLSETFYWQRHRAQSGGNGSERSMDTILYCSSLSHRTRAFPQSYSRISCWMKDNSRNAAGRHSIFYTQGQMISTSLHHIQSDESLVKSWIANRKRLQQRLQRRPDLERPQVVETIVPSFRDLEYESLASTVEEKLGDVLGRPDLIVTRNIEWANIAFGFEQQNKYVIMDPCEPEAPVGYILEESNVLMRQFLRRRRPFVALVLDALGNEVCRVRRPLWFINSSIFVEIEGKVIGEAHRRWHLWRRIYDIYLGKKQFAAVQNPGFWYWTFNLKDENDELLAVIDRNWRGFGYEFLTDAGQYVVRFGSSLPHHSRQAIARKEGIRVSGQPILVGSPSASSEMQNLKAAAAEAESLAVSRPLNLWERAVTLALAVSLDNDYFSNHGSGSGFIPLPFFGGSELTDST